MARVDIYASLKAGPMLVASISSPDLTPDKCQLSLELALQAAKHMEDGEQRTAALRRAADPVCDERNYKEDSDR